MASGRGRSWWQQIGDFFDNIFNGDDSNAYGNYLIPGQTSGYTGKNTGLYGSPDNATILAGTENAITGNLDYQRLLDQMFREQDFNRTEAQKNRDFQLMMSNTAYQRQMDDLQAAGINPALVLGQGGASAMSGSSASSSGKTPADKSTAFLGTLVNGLMNITNSALKAETLEEKKELIETRANAYKKGIYKLPDYMESSKIKQDKMSKKEMEDLEKLAKSLFND